MALIIDMIKKILQNNLITPRFSKLLRRLRLLDINLSTFFNNHNIKFHFIEFGFFDSYFNNKLIKMGVDIKYILKNTYFQNLYIFIL